MTTLGAPVKVSPLIKTGRWVGLIAGLIYGSMHFKSLSKQETLRREEEARIAELRKDEVARELERARQEELAILAKEAGILK